MEGLNFPPPPPWYKLYLNSGTPPPPPGPPDLPANINTIQQFGLHHSTVLNLATHDTNHHTDNDNKDNNKDNNSSTLADLKRQLYDISSTELLSSYAGLLAWGGGGGGGGGGTESSDPSSPLLPYELWFDPDLPRPEPVAKVRAAVLQVLHLCNLARAHQSRLELIERLRRDIADKQKKVAEMLELLQTYRDDYS